MWRRRHTDAPTEAEKGKADPQELVDSNAIWSEQRKKQNKTRLTAEQGCNLANGVSQQI